MKNIIILFALTIFFSACDSGNDLERKKALLTKYKNEQEELRSKIASLEAEIEAADTTNKVIKSKLVNVKAIQPTTFSHFLDMQGMIDSEENILVNSSMPGLVTKIYVKEGDNVTTGQILAEMDNRLISQNISEIETSLELAKTTFEKQKKLWDQKIGSEIQFLQAKTQYESLNKTKSTLQTQLDLTRIKSPINGKVDEVLVKIGETASPGFGVIRVVNNNKMKVTAKIADSYLGRIKNGDPVRIVLRELNDTINSKINFVSSAVNQQTRTFSIEAPLNGGQLNLRPNMLATLSINDETIENAMVLPSNTVQRDASGDEYVLLAIKKGESFEASKRVIKTGYSYDGKTFIKSGLNAGDMLITSGYQDIVDGQIISFN